MGITASLLVTCFTQGWASFMLWSKHSIPEDTVLFIYLFLIFIFICSGEDTVLNPPCLQDFVAPSVVNGTITRIIIFMLNYPILNEVTSGDHLFRE